MEDNMVKIEPTEEKPLLEVELMRVAEIIFGRIKTQNETLRTSSFRFEHENVAIVSSGEPQLVYHCSLKKLSLYVRGIYRDKDYQIFIHRCKNIEESISWAQKIKEAVEAFNKQKGILLEIPIEPLKCERIM
ncbi:MAG: hypothetical protein Q8L01_00265 [Candidatus Woesebacteria bacterium]|nr:hypothetical protein [Candidatus Woesebacteria bacterium]